MMKLGTQIGFSGGLGMSTAQVYKTMSEAGFQSVDFSLMHSYTHPIWKLSDEELKTKMTDLKRIINDNGIFVGQTHATDASWISHPGTEEIGMRALVQGIKASSYLGSPYVVFHCLSPSFRKGETGYEACKEMNMAFYRSLIPYLEEYDVKIAIENGTRVDKVLGRKCAGVCATVEELKDYVDTLNALSDRFVVCLDVGHAVLGGQDPVKMIYELGSKYLHVTHIHDNDLVNDRHMMPGMGKLDWYGIGKALNDIGFDEVFNFEADIPYGRFGDYRKVLSLHLLRVYAELGKAIIRVQ